MESMVSHEDHDRNLPEIESIKRLGDGAHIGIRERNASEVSGNSLGRRLNDVQRHEHVVGPLVCFPKRDIVSAAFAALRRNHDGYETRTGSGARQQHRRNEDHNYEPNEDSSADQVHGNNAHSSRTKKPVVGEPATGHLRNTQHRCYRLAGAKTVYAGVLNRQLHRLLRDVGLHCARLTSLRCILVPA